MKCDDIYCISNSDHQCTEQLSLKSGCKKIHYELGRIAGFKEGKEAGIQETIQDVMNSILKKNKGNIDKSSYIAKTIKLVNEGKLPPLDDDSGFGLQSFLP